MKWLKSLTRLIDRQLPHALVGANHPVFEHELKNSWQNLSVQGVKALSLLRLRAYYKWSAFAWVVILIIALALTRDLTTALNAPISVIASSTILMSLIGTVNGFDYVRATRGAIARYRLCGFWDLLRITQLGENSILMGVYAAALMRAWWSMFREVTTRMVGATALLLAVLQAVLFPARGIYDYVPDPIAQFADGCFLIVALGAYILEPLWRMRAFAALGLCISAFRVDPIFVQLAQFGGVIVAHLVWLVLFFIPTAITIRLLRFVEGNTVSSLNDAVIRLSIALVGGIVTWAFYKALQTGSLIFANRLAFRSE